MHCTTCDTANDADAKFCRACGAPFGAIAPTYVTSHAPMAGMVCPSCRQRNPRDARYCVFCAVPMVQVAAPPAPAMRTVRLGGAAPAMAAPSMVTATATAVAYANPQPMLIAVPHGGNLLVRAIWFVLIGWWLGLVWTIFAWMFNLTLIGLPVGLMMLNAIPTVMTLRPQHGRVLQMLRTSGQVVRHQVQQPFLLRAIWFFLVGWWASLLWMLVAWSLCSTLILMPIAFWMFDRVPTITTLAAE